MIEEILNKQFNEINSKAEELKIEMDTFYKQHEDSVDFILVLRSFIDIFDNKVYSFESKYSKTCPTSLIGTKYDIVAFYNSITISINLKEYYKNIIQKIYDKVPNSDDLQ